MRAHIRGFMLKPVFISLVIIGIGTYNAINIGWYPIARVNSEIISAKRFNEAEEFAVQYYQTISNTRGVSESDIINSPAYRQEIRRATLDKLIENELIYAELKHRVGPRLDALIETKLSTISTSGEDFNEAVSLIYGLTLDRFQEAILIPQAHEEILKERFFTENISFEEWVISIRKDARVLIFEPEFVWVDGQVALQ